QRGARASRADRCACWRPSAARARDDTTGGGPSHVAPIANRTLHECPHFMEVAFELIKQRCAIPALVLKRGGEFVDLVLVLLAALLAGVGAGGGEYCSECDIFGVEEGETVFDVRDNNFDAVLTVALDLSVHRADLLFELRGGGAKLAAQLISLNLQLGERRDV